MKVSNMKSPRTGRDVPNQFVLKGIDRSGRAIWEFQSYKSTIIRKVWDNLGLQILLDKNLWNYSKTTSKYRNIFLGESTKETQAKIDSGEYILCDLN